MGQKDKELLLRDICARQPYHVIVSTGEEDLELVKVDILNETIYLFSESILEFDISEVKPYLRPMSSMTYEEYEESKSINEWTHLDDGTEVPCMNYVDWLLSHHFDIRGLIEKGLAKEAPKGMY